MKFSHIFFFAVLGAMSVAASSEASVYLSLLSSHDEKILLAQAIPSAEGDCNVGRDNNGSVNCHNNFFGNPPIHVTDEARKQILSKVSKSRSIEVWYELGASETENLATELREFLSSNGYNVTKFQGAMMFPEGAQPHGIVVELNNDNLNLPVRFNVWPQ